ncbi:hypothetical protein JW898_04525 [Candidatus Woesearchaeota archaeon]|nr:hypothetical protein [Candidatus Woesearchaeota archaeon]
MGGCVGRDFIDETDLSIGPLEKADACFEAGSAALRVNADSGAERLLLRAMQLYDMAGRPDRVLRCAQLLGKDDQALYKQTAIYFFEKGNDVEASRLVREHCLVDLIEKYSAQYLVE